MGGGATSVTALKMKANVPLRWEKKNSKEHCDGRYPCYSHPVLMSASVNTDMGKGNMNHIIFICSSFQLHTFI